MRCLESLRGFVDNLNPTERLIRRRDVVVVGGEYHEQVFDGGEIDRAVIVDPELPLLQLVPTNRSSTIVVISSPLRR